MKLYRVEGVEVSLDRREARRNGEPLRLRPMTFDLLVYLISHRDRLPGKEELLAHLWKGTAVTENSLMQCIGELRKALDDDARQPRLIQTVAKTGYRFIGPVEEVNEPPAPLELPLLGREVAPLAPGAFVPSWRVWILAAGLVAAAVLVTSFRVNPTSAKQPSWSITENLEAYRYYSLGVQKAQQFHAKEAVELFQKAIALDPGFAMAHARIGYAYSIAWSRPDTGRPYLERAFQLSSRLRDQDRLYVTAWYAQANLDYEGAIRSYREAISRYPEETEAYQQLAALCIGEERYGEAARIIQAALQVDPASPQNYNLLSSLDLSTSKFDEAVSAAQRFVALAPLEPNAHDSLGLALEARGNFLEAESAYLAALRLQPGFEIAMLHFGHTLVRMGRYREALQQFQHYIAAVSLLDERRRGFDAVALVHRLRGEVAEASVAAGQDPAGEAAVLLALDRNDQILIDQFLTRRPLSGDRGKRVSQRFLLSAYGQRAMAAGNLDQALSYFRQALETRTPFYAFNWYEDCLGDAYSKAGRTQEAIEEYHRVLGRYPKLALVWYHLGQAFEHQGMHTEARGAMARFLELWKDADRDIPEVIAARQLVATKA
jgi:tetratricopeptide (TPR) repeat protein/DNA-binding winged helix-turn-helix (wHTH) protein